MDTGASEARAAGPYEFIGQGGLYFANTGNSAQLFLRTFFNFVLPLPPPLPGCPGESSDFHVPKAIYDFGQISARTRRVI